MLVWNKRKIQGSLQRQNLFIHQGLIHRCKKHNPWTTSGLQSFSIWLTQTTGGHQKLGPLVPLGMAISSKLGSPPLDLMFLLPSPLLPTFQPPSNSALQLLLDPGWLPAPLDSALSPLPPRPELSQPPQLQTVCHHHYWSYCNDPVHREPCSLDLAQHHKWVWHSCIRRSRSHPRKGSNTCRNCNHSYSWWLMTGQKGGARKNVEGV